MKITPTRVKGDTLLFDFTINSDIDGWDVRAEFYDDCSNSIKLANTESGGSDNQIEIVSTSSTLSSFTIKVQKALTADFKNKAFLEVEVENTESPTQIFTIFQGEIALDPQKIDWTTP